MSLNHLFVYGTLQKDLDNDMSKFLSKHAVPLSRGYVLGKLYKISWFPGMILSENASEKVFGTIFKLKTSEPLFKVLDNYEGFDINQPNTGLFKREQVIAYLNDGSSIKVWAYTYNQTIVGRIRIWSGDFLKFSSVK